MRTIALEQVGGQLAEIIERLPPGEEVVQTRGDKPVATIRATPAEPPPRPVHRLGTMEGTILDMAPDFDAISEGFEDYV